MKIKSALTVVAASAAALLAQSVFAQASAPASRAEVKREAAATHTPAGEGSNVKSLGTTAPSTSSTKSRTERKSETQSARATGELKPAGPETGAREQNMEKAKTSTTSRAARKAETAAAEKTPAGEAARPAAEPQKK